jgi:hypothetical protein
MVFRAFSTPFGWVQYKRGLSSPPVVLSAFQAYSAKLFLAPRIEVFLFIMYIINFFEKKFGGFGNVVYLCGVDLS